MSVPDPKQIKDLVDAGLKAPDAWRARHELRSAPVVVGLVVGGIIWLIGVNIPSEPILIAAPFVGLAAAFVVIVKESP